MTIGKSEIVAVQLQRNWMQTPLGLICWPIQHSVAGDETDPVLSIVHQTTELCMLESRASTCWLPQGIQINCHKMCSTCWGGLTILQNKQNKNIFCGKTHTRTHAYTGICICSRCWKYLVSVKAVQPHIGDEINHRPLDTSEDTLRGLYKPTAFTLFPYGNIHRCCLKWHSLSESMDMSSTGLIFRTHH